MRAYIIETDKKIEPFNDHPKDCLIVNRKLSEIQKDILNSLEIEWEIVPSDESIDDNDYIVFSDNVLFTREILQQFIEESRALKKSTVCSLKPGIVTNRSMINTQDIKKYKDRIEYGLHYINSNIPKESATPVIFDPDQLCESIPMPEHIEKTTKFFLPVSDIFIIQLDHWTNILSANMCMLLSAGARLKKLPRMKLLLLALKARSGNPWKVLRQINKIGNDCDIHPTAYIEGSVIGRNVTIGAGSVIRQSIIGDNTFIGNNATIEASVTGEWCNIRNGAILQFTVMYSGSFTMARLISVSLCGRNTFIADGSVLTDFRLDGKSIRVLKNNSLIDTQNTFIGSCLGHNVYIGSGCIVSPGRSVPNGYRICVDGSRTINKIPDNKPNLNYRIIDMINSGDKEVF